MAVVRANCYMALPSILWDSWGSLRCQGWVTQIPLCVWVLELGPDLRSELVFSWKQHYFCPPSFQKELKMNFNGGSSRNTVSNITVTLYTDRWLLDLPWWSRYELYKCWNAFVVHLKLIKYCMSTLIKNVETALQEKIKSEW